MKIEIIPFASIYQYLVEPALYKARLYSVAPPGRYEEKVDDKTFFANKYGFTPEKINESITNLLSK